MKDPGLVLDFYNQRRREVLNCLPNQAHIGLAELEEDFDVQIITQNIDDLHERGGSTNILHLHGEILKMRSVNDPFVLFAYNDDIKLGDLAADGGQFRPHVVWFNEDVPKIIEVKKLVSYADIFVVIGTSLNVFPAANVLDYVKISTPVFVIDKQIPNLNGFFDKRQKTTLIKANATDGVLNLKEQLSLYK